MYICIAKTNRCCQGLTHSYEHVVFDIFGLIVTFWPQNLRLQLHQTWKFNEIPTSDL